MPIQANVTNNQITASVGETQIDVNVSGGVGPTGNSGAAATVTVGTVTTGAAGSSASVVNAGTSSAAVLNFTIPAGATGATGPQGPQGPAGSNASATTDASALVTGTLPDARLSANIARTSDVSSAVAALVNSSPAALDTLGELATALGNDANFSTTVTNAIAGKAAAVHTHVIADVTGLQAALDGKQAAGSYAAASHSHGNITNAGAIGSTSGQIVVTTTSGVLTTAATISSAAVTGLPTAGTGSTNYCAGNDARLSDSRTPTGAAGGDLAGNFPNPTLAASGVTAGTYTSVTVDAKGRVTAGSNPSSGGVKLGLILALT